MHALHKQDLSLMFGASSAEKSQKLLRTLCNRDRKRKERETRKDETQRKPSMSVISVCSSSVLCYCAPIFRAQKALRGYRENEAEFHPITSGYMTLTEPLRETDKGKSAGTGV